jgi:hypothetical protein
MAKDAKKMASKKAEKHVAPESPTSDPTASSSKAVPDAATSKELPNDDPMFEADPPAGDEEAGDDLPTDEALQAYKDAAKEVAAAQEAEAAAEKMREGKVVIALRK